MFDNEREKGQRARAVAVRRYYANKEEKREGKRKNQWRERGGARPG